MRSEVIVGAVLLAGVLAAACASPRGTTNAPGSEEARYVRVVDAFPVVDAEGEPYAMPFLGGLNVPRPQFVDIDADGDLDLFVQEYTGSVMFFENVGTADEPEFVWRTDAFRGLDVGEWYRFTDLDDDGDPDLLAEQPFSYIRYYRNEGTPQAPKFVQAADTLKDVEGTPIFSDRQNIPNVTDIDCDGQPDLFLGRLDGTVTRYEAVGSSQEGVPVFRHVTDRFQDISIVAQFGSLHGANTLAFVDIDHDGDVDLFWGDYFEAGLLFIENTGSCTTPVLRGQPVPFPPTNPMQSSGYNAPTFGDLDGDGALDLLVGVIGGAFNPTRTAAANLYYFRHRPEQGYERVTRRFLDGIDVGSESIPAFGDLDADGDQDVLLANKIDPSDAQSSRVRVFENRGTETRPSFVQNGALDLPAAYHYAPALGDLDDDGDLDLLLGTWNKGVDFYRNEGSAEQAEFVVAQRAFVELSRGSNSTPALVDIDADGDLDLFVGEASGTLNFFRNEGSAKLPDFRLVSDEYQGIDAGRRSHPTFLDVDDDGDQDLLIGTEADGIRLYRNWGTSSEPSFEEDGALPIAAPAVAAPALVDIDADGDVDVFVGDAAGGLMFFERR